METCLKDSNKLIKEIYILWLKKEYGEGMTHIALGGIEDIL